MIDEELADDFCPLNDEEIDNDFDQTITQDSQVKPPRKRKSNTTVDYKWTVDEQIKLIGEVEKFICLYDEGSEMNKDKFRREASWKSVAAALGDEIPASQCQAKWTSLRASLRKCVRNMKTHKSGQATSSAKPTWRFYDHMKFVVEADKKNKMLSESNFVSTCTVMCIILVLASNIYLFHTNDLIAEFGQFDRR